MTDIRRTLLWVVFTMSLVFLWDAWNKHTGQPSLFGVPMKPAASASAPPQAAVPGAASAGGPSMAGVPAVASTVASAASGVADAPATAAAKGERLVLATDVLKATFDSVGASLVRLELLAYRDQNDAQSKVVLFDQSPKRQYAAQTGLVSTQAGVVLPNHHTPMTVVPGPRALEPGKDEISVRFESPVMDGRKLAKTYTFKRGQYTVAVKHEFFNDGATPVTPLVYLQLTRDGNPPEGESSFYSTFTGPAVYTDANKFAKVEFKDIEKKKAEHDKTADNGWVAMVQHYFATAWVLPGNAQREFRSDKIGDNLYTIAMVTSLGEVAPGATKALDATLFAGPQEETKLAALAPGLELVKDYGYLHLLAKPLFWLLDKLNGMLGNWGWAIVALVVLLKMAFYWLNASAYRSMAKMKALNPKMMEMRERLKDKPQEMQQAMMKLYRDEKANPLGGCLPIVAQMPFFIALYWVLLSSVEMRNAPWIFWIVDLADKDPWFVLPVLMTLSSLAQVALGAKPPDPVQARMMWFMPLAFGVMFFFFPAGLVLYWLTNNLLSIAQQWFINKQMGVSNR